MYLRKFSIISILVLSLLLTGCAGVAFAQDATPVAQAGSGEGATRTLNVSGSGKAVLTPDIAYVNIGVRVEDSNAAKAVSANNEQAATVIAAISQLGVDEKDIRTTNFSIYPQQEYDPQGKPTGKITYIVENSVHVTVRDLDTIGELLDAAVQSGANMINGIQFDVADKTMALSTARQAAVAAAKAKAEELADAADVSLGDVQTITERSDSYPVPMYERAAVSMVAESAVPISPGQMELTIEVHMVYEIQ